MAKYQLSIPEPCKEKWEEMKPTSYGAFCSSCQKEVVDFTRMSERQIVGYFRRSEDKVCGRFRDEQLEQTYGDVTTAPAWRKWFVAALLGIGAPGLALAQQAKPALRQNLNEVRQTLPKIERLKLGESLLDKLQGSVLDAETGEPMAGVVVSDGEKTLAITDQAGDFTLPYNDLLGVDTLHFSSLGYDPLSIASTDWKERLIAEMLPTVCALAKDTRRTVHVKLGGAIAVSVPVKRSLPGYLWWKIKKMVGAD